MTPSEVGMQVLIQKAIKNDIGRKDMEILHKKLLKRYNTKKRKKGLDSQQERIILAACISYDDLPSRLWYINERMEEWREKAKTP